MIIDTHLHIIDQSALRYPWLAGAPALNRDFPYEEYAREAKRGGIRADAAHGGRRRPPPTSRPRPTMSASCRRQPGSLLVGAIAACRPEDKGFAAFLERQQVEPVREGLSPRAARHAGRAFGKRAVPRKHEAAGRHRPDLRPLRPAAPDSARRSRSPTWRPTCSSCSTIAACPTSRAVPSIRGAST